MAMQPTRMLLPLFALAAFAAAQDAQDPLLAARQKLQKSLAAMAALPSCAFDAKWAVDDDGKKKDDTNVVVLGVTDPPGDAKGAWGDGALYLQSGDDEVLYAGRRMLARENGGEWALRRGRYQNGATLEFQPDPQLLFQILSAMDLAVVHREAGALHDRPVETLTVTLNQDQVAELARAGLLPQSVTGATAINGMMFAFAAGGGKAARPVPPAPDATVDIAFHLDPGTGMVHRMVVRGTAKGNAAMGGHVVFAGGAGAVRVVRTGGGDDDDEEKEDAKEPPKDAPLQYKDGLPQRPRKKMQVYDYAIDLRDHGTAKLPALDDKQKALLGR
jgi:hypothetical protein